MKKEEVNQWWDNLSDITKSKVMNLWQKQLPLLKTL